MSIHAYRSTSVHVYIVFISMHACAGLAKCMYIVNQTACNGINTVTEVAYQYMYIVHAHLNVQSNLDLT